jgi:RecA/RadA recombinase
MHRDRRIVLIAGEPGVGKTRLAEHFGSAAIEQGATVLVGRCAEEPLAPFEPYVEALAHAGVSEALTPGGGGDDAGARHRLFSAVDAAFTDLAGRSPLMLLIDDFHWADRATLLLTGFLLRSSRPGPILVLGTYRDTELGRLTPLTAALGDFKRAGALHRIGLQGLALDEVAALARSVVGTDDDAGRVYARTAGNPFFAEEVLRELAESGPGAVPESVRHAVGVRLSRMSDDANQLMAAAAILGLEHDVYALQATAGLTEGHVEAALDETLRARLLRPTATERRVTFSHALVREAVLDELNVLRRARLHRRAADALATLGEQQHLDEIAMHLFEAASAADARHAAEMLIRAGRRAVDRLAYEDAAERFHRAVQALEMADAQEESGLALVARGDALLRAGDPAAARAVFTEARALALRYNDDQLLSEAALGFAGLGIAIVDLDLEAIARLQEALERVADRTLRSRLQARLAVESYYADDRTRSERYSADAVANARASRDPSTLASALSAQHVALWRPDRLEQRLAVTTEMIAAALEAGDRQAELQARNWRVADLFELGDTMAWRAEAERHARLAAELRLPAFEWYTPLWAATDAMLAGRSEDVEHLCQEAEAAGLQAGDRNAVLSTTMVRFSDQCQHEAYDVVARAFVEERIANSPAGIAYRGGYAWILAGLGEIDMAREQLHTAMGFPHAFDANWLSLEAELAEASVLIGDDTFASTLYDRLAPYAGRPVTAGRAICSYGAVDLMLGHLAVMLGRRSDAVRHLKDAVALNARFGCVVWRARAERDLANVAGAS